MPGDNSVTVLGCGHTVFSLISYFRWPFDVAINLSGSKKPFLSSYSDVAIAATRSEVALCIVVDWRGMRRPV